MFPFMKLGYQKDSSKFNWTEKQTCFLNETFSDNAIEKLYFMEEKTSLFLECNLFWRHNSSKNQSWSSIFIEEKKSLNDTFLQNECKTQKNQFWRSIFIIAKKCLFLAKARRISLEALFSLKRKMSMFREWHLFTMQKSEASVLKLYFHWREKESASWMKCFLPTHKSRKWVLKLPFHWREKGLFREWELFYHCKSQKGQSWSCIFIEEKRACFLNDTFSDDAKVFLRRIRGASCIA